MLRSSSKTVKEVQTLRSCTDLEDFDSWFNKMMEDIQKGSKAENTGGEGEGAKAAGTDEKESGVGEEQPVRRK